MIAITTPHTTKYWKPKYYGDTPGETYIKFTSAMEDELRMIQHKAHELRDRTATDAGTCVLGAGIVINVFMPRQRTPTPKMFLRAPFQGNVGSYKALKPCLDWLKENYPQLHPEWEDGNMD